MRANINYIPQGMYDRIRRVIPRTCVDILIRKKNHFLLVMRGANDTEPCVPWIPGGRMFMYESQIEGCYRILERECNLNKEMISQPKLLGNMSFISSHPKGFSFHDVASIYYCDLKSPVDYVKTSDSHRWIRFPDLCPRPESISQIACDYNDYIDIVLSLLYLSEA